MTNSKRTTNVDDVLADYVLAAPEFDANVLQSFVKEHPEYATALRRYAQLQLTSAPASPEEVEQEEVGDDELLRIQSKVLQKMQDLRNGPSREEVEDAAGKLGTVSGLAASRAATRAVFGACEHGEETVLLHIIEPPGVVDVPEWVFSRLGSHLDVPVWALRAALPSIRSGAWTQRYSATDKPVQAQPVSWDEVVRECIDDEKVQQILLESPGPPACLDNRETGGVGDEPF